MPIEKLLLLTGLGLGLSYGAETAAPTAKADARPPFEERLAAVLSFSPAADTAGLLEEIGRRLGFGENDDRLRFAQGHLQFQAGDFGAACISLRKIRVPDLRSTALLAECLDRKGERFAAAPLHLKAARLAGVREPRALEYYRRYLAVFPDEAAVKTEFALALVGQGRSEEAARLFAGMASVSPERLPADPSLLRAMAAALEKSRPEEAAPVLARLNTLSPSFEGLSREALLLQSLGRLAAAEAAWRKALDLKPDHADAFNHLAHLLRARGDAAGLEKLLLQGEKRSPGERPSPEDPSRSLEIARLQIRNGARDRAYARLDLLLSAKPDHAEALLLLPAALNSDSLLLANRSRLETAYRLNPKETRHLLAPLARAFSLSGDRAGASRLWVQLYRLAPGDSALLGQGLSDLSEAARREEMQVLERLARQRLEARPGDSLAAAALISVHLRQGRLDSAFVLALEVAGQVAQAAHGATTRGAAHDGERIRALCLPVATSLAAAGRHAEARNLLEDLLKREGHAEIAFLLGKLSLQAGHPDEALSFLHDGLSFSPESHLLIGQAYKALGDGPRALAALEEYEARVGDGRALPALVELASAQKQVRKAREFAALLARKQPQARHDLILAHLDLALADTAAALLALEQSLAKTAPDPSLEREARGLLGRILARRVLAAPAPAGNAVKGGTAASDRAIAHLERFHALGPGDRETFTGLGRLYEARGRRDLAQAAYRRAAEAGGDDLELARRRLKLAREAGRPAQLEEAYAGLFRLDPRDAEAAGFLAEQAYRKKRFAEALPYFASLAEPEGAAKRIPGGETRFWSRYGHALLEAGRAEEAGTALQKALDLGSTETAVFIHRARAYRALAVTPAIAERDRKANRDMAQSILGFLLETRKKEYLTLLWAGRFAEEDGDPGAALGFYAAAAKAKPAGPDRDGELARSEEAGAMRGSAR